MYPHNFPTMLRSSLIILYDKASYKNIYLYTHRITHIYNTPHWAVPKPSPIISHNHDRLQLYNYINRLLQENYNVKTLISSVFVAFPRSFASSSAESDITIIVSHIIIIYCGCHCRKPLTVFISQKNRIINLEI